jgi:hypothetical protein
MYSFAKFVADHIFLQNRDKKYKKNSYSADCRNSKVLGLRSKLGVREAMGLDVA